MILSNKGKKFNKIGHSLNLLHYQYDALRGGAAVCADVTLGGLLG